mmetsp:Transcript_27990/g.36146  ORF Transcript_27990/g.36146 Transcript_27990/m.36146 type:complete len:116 (+) Transcript_27990:90-437(+)
MNRNGALHNFTLCRHQWKRAGGSSLVFVGVLMSRGGALLTVSLPIAWWLNMDAIGVELLLRASSSAVSISLSLLESYFSTSLMYLDKKLSLKAFARFTSIISEISSADGRSFTFG